MIWSDRSSSRPWQATTRTSTSRVCSVPDGLVDAVRHPDELEVRVVGQGPLDVEGVQALDGDECADESVSHGAATSPACFAWPGRGGSHRHGQRRRLLGADLRAQEEPERPGVRGERELLRQRRGCLEDVRRRLALHRRAKDLDVYLVARYRELGRDPTDVELMMFAQANSEHCRHKIFNAEWYVDGEKQDALAVPADQAVDRGAPGGRAVGVQGQRGGRRGPAAERFFPDADGVYRGHAEAVAHPRQGRDPQPPDRDLAVPRRGDRLGRRDPRRGRDRPRRASRRRASSASRCRTCASPARSSRGSRRPSSGSARRRGSRPRSTS